MLVKAERCSAPPRRGVTSSCRRWSSSTPMPSAAAGGRWWVGRFRRVWVAVSSCASSPTGNRRERLGDLDLASQRTLLAILGTKAEDLRASASADADLDIPRPVDALNKASPSKTAASAPPLLPAVTLARPGTVLVREHGGSHHRVMVLDDGFAWNGRTYDSLTQVAFAITGTRWNGPRFFGLRPGAKPSASARP